MTDEERQEKLARQHRDDVRSVMSTKSGRRLLHRVIEHSGMFRPTIGPNHSSTEYQAGMRQVGLMVWSDINIFCHELAILMQQENHHVHRPDSEDQS